MPAGFTCHRAWVLYRFMLFFGVSFALGGCATREAHYGRFDAVNSAGEPRSFLLTWQTQRYPAWTTLKDVASPVRLETQCSEREWILRDAESNACRVSGSGSGEPAAIRACGKPGTDLDRQGVPIVTEGHQCLSLTDRQGSASIAALGTELQLMVGCYPVSTRYEDGDETVNVDYLRTSAVPYIVRVRTAPLYSMSERPPALDDAVCTVE